MNVINFPARKPVIQEAARPSTRELVEQSYQIRVEARHQVIELKEAFARNQALLHELFNLISN